MQNSLFTIHNNAIEEMEISEIFDNQKYDELIAVTYSASPTFINKYLVGFKKMKLIIGSEQYLGENTASKIIAQQIIDNITRYDHEMINEWNSYQTPIKEKIAHNQFDIFYLKTCKFMINFICLNHKTITE